MPAITFILGNLPVDDPAGGSYLDFRLILAQDVHGDGAEDCLGVGRGRGSAGGLPGRTSTDPARIAARSPSFTATSPLAACAQGRRRVWEADYRVRDYDRDGVLDLSSADTRFCFGCSYPMLARPVRIWHYRTGRLVDVTRAFPGVVSFYARVDRREVAHIRRGDGAYHGFAKRRLVEFSRLYLGVYVADTCLLGRCLRGWRFAGALAHGGDLGRGSSTYLKRLHRYLVRLGYWN